MILSCGLQNMFRSKIMALRGSEIRLYCSFYRVYIGMWFPFGCTDVWLYLMPYVTTEL
jgi:hypothetical protein